MSASYKLIYYDIRGIVEPVRWMFRIANVPFEDVRIPLKDWSEEKHRFANHLERLPILCVGNKQEFSQAHSILWYVARECDFDGTTEEERIRADEIVELLHDFRLRAASHTQWFTSQTPDIVHHTVFQDIQQQENLSKKVLMKKTLLLDYFPKYLDKINAIFRQSGGPYLAGSKMTYADLAFANFIDICEGNVNPDILDNYPDFQSIVEEVFEIPAVKEWIAAEKCPDKLKSLLTATTAG